MKLTPVALIITLVSTITIVSPTKAEAQLGCYTRDSEGNCIDIGRERDQLGAACVTTANFSTCQNYHSLWCQQGFQASCHAFNLSRSNPQYYQQVITANKFCFAGNGDACIWLKQQGF
ncbi:MAG: hypothetical protein KME17_24130 [Cyanosarcina radialis HA8281-LM2]|nr:hypothetical protein [Cyanosarcina radialis HA8281-LM2]